MTAVFGISRSYFKRFKFVVEILGVPYAGFMSAGPLRIEVAPVDHWEGGALIPSSSPGRITIPPITLRRGATTDLDLFLWMQQVVAADSILVEPDFKRVLDVVQQDRKGVELRRWTLIGAYPIAWSGGEWDNDADENVVEEVVLKYDYPTVGGDTSP